MILIDSRLGSADLVAPLNRMGLPVTITTLDAGDVLFEGRGIGGKPVSVAIEYKTLGELIASLRTGRLQDVQATAMQTFDFRWLLIEGELIYGKDGKLLRRTGRQAFALLSGGMTMGELWKRLFVLQLTMGLTPLLVPHRRDTLKVIEALYRTWTDVDLDQHQSHLAMYEPPTLAPLSQFRRTIRTLPEVGILTSLALERRFKTLRRAFAAPAERWAEVTTVDRKGDTRKFGNKRAARVEAALDGET